MGYKTQNKSTYLIKYHIIWCPKYRRKILLGTMKDRCEQIIREAIHEKRCSIEAIEIMPEHIHVLVNARPDESPHRIVKAMKGRTSNILRKEFPELLRMPTLWSRSYFLSTVGNVSANIVKEYIENQWNNFKKNKK